MTALILPRRKFLTGIVGVIAAPAIVRVTSLMPVKSFIKERGAFPGIITNFVRVVSIEPGRIHIEWVPEHKEALRLWGEREAVA